MFVPHQTTPHHTESSPPPRSSLTSYDANISNYTITIFFFFTQFFLYFHSFHVEWKILIKNMPKSQHTTAEVDGNWNSSLEALWIHILQLNWLSTDRYYQHHNACICIVVATLCSRKRDSWIVNLLFSMNIKFSTFSTIFLLFSAALIKFRTRKTLRTKPKSKQTL